MKTHLIAIGNSRGIRIPKIFIKKCGLHQYVKIDIQGNNLIISPDNSKRGSWETLFSKDGETERVDLIANKFDVKEWEW